MVLQKVNLGMAAVMIGLCLYHLLINPIDWPNEVIFPLVAVLNLGFGVEELRDKSKRRGIVYLAVSLSLFIAALL